MERGIPESDWKLFRRLRTVALERFCERVLGEVCGLAASCDTSNHQRYLAVFRHLQGRDGELADMFNAPRRSVALGQLARIRSQGLLTDEEFDQFSSQTHASVRTLLEIWQA